MNPGFIGGGGAEEPGPGGVACFQPLHWHYLQPGMTVFYHYDVTTQKMNLLEEYQ